jgi:hypothetical protein
MTARILVDGKVNREAIPYRITSRPACFGFLVKKFAFTAVDARMPVSMLVDKYFTLTASGVTALINFYEHSAVGFPIP